MKSQWSIGRGLINLQNQEVEDPPEQWRRRENVDIFYMKDGDK